MSNKSYCNGSIVLPFGKAEDAKVASIIAMRKFQPFNSVKNILGLPINPSMKGNYLLAPKIEIDPGIKLCLIKPGKDEKYYQRHCLILPVRGDITNCRIPLSWLAIIHGKIPAIVADELRRGKSLVRLQFHSLERLPFYDFKLLFLRNLKDCL